MYVARIPNRNSPPAYLIREGYREGGKVKTRTIANITKLGGDKIEMIRRILKGETLVPAEEAVEILRALPHGHVAAALGTARTIGLERFLDRQPSRRRALCLAMIVAHLLDPASKRAIARALDPETAQCSLGPVLDLGAVGEDELHEALDWLARRQDRIERRLARSSSRTAPWCSTTSPRPGWRGGTAILPLRRTTATAKGTSRGSPSACYA